MASQNQDALPEALPESLPTRSGQRKKALLATIIFVALVVVISLITFVRVVQKPAAKIDITSSSFTPETLQVAKGSKVTWTNTDSVAHRLAAEPFPLNNSIPGFNSNIVLQPHDSYTLQFSKAGTYHYYDYKDHFNMTGTVIVK